MTGEQLFGICTISRREEDKERGYQRLLNKNRAQKIASYIDRRRGLLPNNLIIAFTDKVKFQAGKLLIPKVRDAALVIDGQHRLWGLHLADADFAVAVVGFIGLDPVRQKELFITINKEQKGVPSSLYLDLLPDISSIVDIDVAQERAIDLAKALEEEDTSPWWHDINLTGEGKGAISLTNFVRKLKPLLTQPTISTLLYEEQYKLLLNYFSAVKNVFLDQWNDAKSLIRKTVGFGALMEALPEVFALTRSEKGATFTIEAVTDILRAIEDFKFDRTNLGAGSGTAAEKAAATAFTDALLERIRSEKEAGGEGLVKF